MESHQTRKMLKLTQGLFFLNAAVWLLFGVLSLLRAIDEGGLIRWTYTILMIANAVAMAWFGTMIVGRRNWVFFLAILYVAINVVLSITDQFGWIDVLILLLNLCLLGLLLITRRRMNQTTKASAEEL